MNTLLVVSFVAIFMTGCHRGPSQVQLRETAFKNMVSELVPLVENAVKVEKAMPSGAHCSQVAQELRATCKALPDVAHDRKLTQALSGLSLIASSFENRSVYLDLAIKHEPLNHPAEFAKCKERADDMFTTISQGLDLVQKNVALEN